VATVKTSAAVASHPGRFRERNEDCAGLRARDAVTEVSLDGRVCSVVSVGEPVLVVVADGLGGHPCGDLASQLAIGSLVQASTTNADELVVAVHAANASIYAAMDDVAKLTMGTTVAAVLVHAEGIAVVNVGDSAVLELVDGELVELSVMDGLSAVDDPYGFNSSVVTQTLGGRATHEEIAPHLFELDHDGSRRLLACTDGLTNYADQAAIAAALGATRPETAAQALIDLALAGGGGDNITVAVLDIA
jgi:PPM family protein phosphatase